MSEEIKNPVTEPETPETEQASAPAEPAAPEAAAPETEQPAEDAKADDKEDKSKKKEKDGFFSKKLKTEAEAAKAKAEAAEKAAAAAKDQLLRTVAEYENYRKRTVRELDGRFNDGIGYAITQILGILDTLDMAANAPCTDENYKKGVTMTLDKASKALETLKVQEIEALGKPFDPNLHSAVQQVPAEEGQESGQVVNVYQKGYTLGDKVIRHATVVVSE